MVQERKRKILLIEDDSAILDVYETVMRKANFEVKALSLGQEAIKVIKDSENNLETKPDVVVLDLILPDMNGAQVLEEIRKNSFSKDIKVFVLTNQEKVEFSEGIKPDKVIIKANITPTHLVEVLKKELL